MFFCDHIQHPITQRLARTFTKLTSLRSYQNNDDSVASRQIEMPAIATIATSTASARVLFFLGAVVLGLGCAVGGYVVVYRLV
jgi:hypothetical protein